MTWITNDTKPDAYAPVLVAYEQRPGADRVLRVAYFDKHGGYWREADGLSGEDAMILDPTHWMHLPQPPDEPA